MIAVLEIGFFSPTRVSLWGFKIKLWQGDDRLIIYLCYVKIFIADTIMDVLTSFLIDHWNERYNGDKLIRWVQCLNVTVGLQLYNQLDYV